MGPMRPGIGTAGRLLAVALLGALAAGCVGDLADPGGARPTRGTTMTDPPTNAPGSGTSPGPVSSTDPLDLDGQLRQAAWANDVATAAALIAQGADVNAKDSTIQSAYLIATSEGYVDLLDLALANGADVNDKDSWNGTGLIRAAERGHWLVVGMLLRAGIDRDHVNRIGYQAIHEAVWFGRDDDAYATTIRVLAAGGVELAMPSDVERLTPLEMARQRGHSRLEQILLRVAEEGSVLDVDDVLLRAAAAGDADLVAHALRAGADLEARDGGGRTALLLAAAGDHIDVARVLVALGADPDALDGRHDTPWLVTGVTGSVPMLETILLAKPDLTIRNRFGGVAVIPAAERGHVEYVRRVVTTGIDVNHVNDLGWTALLEAVILGTGGPEHQEIVRILLAAAADPAIADRDGQTALEHARARGRSEIVAVLEDR